MKNFIRAFLFSLLIVAVATIPVTQAHAQIVTKVTVVKDSTVSTDTTVLKLALDNNTKSVEFHATKVSGTVAGKVYLQGTVDGTNWDTVDSLTYANQATNYKVFSLTHLTYAQYRFQAIGSGSNKIKPIVAYIHRRSN